MFQNINAPEIASYEVQEAIIKKCSSITNEKRRKKYLVIILLCIDAGLRPTEIASMEIGDIDFRNGELGLINVRTAKQKARRDTGEKRVKIRRIPMTRRLRDAIAEHAKELRLTNEYQVLFPAESEKGHMNRKSVWRIIRKYSSQMTNPKTLRHTFATKIVENSGIRTAQYLMGHESQQTTEIYSHINPMAVQRAIRDIDRRTLAQRVRDFFYPRKIVGVIEFEKGQMGRFHVGREKELGKLSDLAAKKVNILLLGKQGTGKTHLLDNFKEGSVIRIDDFSSVKKALQGVILFLFNGDKDAIARAMFGEPEEVYHSDGSLKNPWDVKVVQDTIKNLCDLLVKITDKNEYTLVIDDVERVGVNAVKALEFLRNHFHMVVAARKIPISKATFLTNFDRVELKELSRPETMELIDLATRDLKHRITDYSMLQNKIWDNCSGNPQFTLEYIDRMRKEPGDVDYELISSIEHTAARPQIDMTLPVLICAASLMILRYYGREAGADKDAFMFIGGAVMILMLFARPLFNAGKRKYV